MPTQLRTIGWSTWTLIFVLLIIILIMVNSPISSRAEPGVDAMRFKNRDEAAKQLAGRLGA